MNVMGISVYFIVILVGVLLGLTAGLSILSFIQNRKEKKKYARVMQEALGFEDGVQKIRKRKEKEERRRRKKEEKRLERERRRAEAEADDSALEDDSEEVPISEYEEPDADETEIRSDETPDATENEERAESEGKSDGKRGFGGFFGKKKEKEEGVLAGRIRNSESYSEMLCDGDGDDASEIIHGKLRTQDDKYRIKRRKDKGKS